jgi:hypothetical protein
MHKMQDTKSPKTDNQIFYWAENLVGTSARFSINLLISLVGGLVYSFKIWPSVYALVVFGVISPLLFTLCLYFLIRYLSQSDDSPFPKILISRSSGSLMMLADMALIIAMAVLIQLNVINYLAFRILQTIIFPALLLILLRALYLSITEDDSADELDL